MSARSPLRRAGFALLATGLGLLLVEAAASVALGLVEGEEDVAGGWSARSEDWVVNTRGAFEEGLFVADRHTLWRARPHYLVPPTEQGYWGPSELRLNEHGHRNPPMPLAKPEGIRRILVLGGSHPFGMWVGSDESYSARLQQRLGPGWQVLNAACPGHTTFQGARYLETYGLAFDPDVVVFDLGVNDELPLSADFAQPDHVVAAVPWWITQLVSIADLSSTYLMLKHFVPSRGPEGGAGMRVPPDQRYANVAHAQAVASSAGARVLLVSQLVEDKGRVQCTEPYQGHGEVLDLCEVFAARGDVSTLFQDPIHANAAGHALIAAALHERLTELGWLR